MVESVAPEEITFLLQRLEEQSSGYERQLNDQAPSATFDAQRLRAVRAIHEDFSRRFAAAASALLRTPVEFKLAGINLNSYSEFFSRASIASSIYVVKAIPLEEPLFLEIGSSLLFPIIDRLLGGSANSQTSLRRPLTEIEEQLVRRVADLFLAEVRAAWESTLPLEISIERTQSDLKSRIPPSPADGGGGFASLNDMSPENSAVLVQFTMRFGEIQGHIDLCLPSSVTECVCGEPGSVRQAAIDRQSAVHWLSGPIVEVVAELATTQLSTADLLALRVGDVISTEQDASQPLMVSIDGHPKYYAAPGAFNGHKAVRIVDSFEERNDCA